MAWHGYALLEINAGFADSLTAAQRDKVRDGLRQLVTLIKRYEGNGDWPPYLLQMRWSLNRRALLVEANFDNVTKAQIVQRIATQLGYTTTQVNNALTITVFGAGKTWAESRAACLAYIAANRAAWETKP